MADDKKTALDAAMKQLQKKFGIGAVMRMREVGGYNIESSSTGSLTLDIATGIGGLPKGRIIEIYGPESSGKTTLALHCVAEVQKKGGTAAFIDAEHALDPIYASNLGVVVDDLIVSQPDYGEQALEITEQLVSSGAIDIVVIDSVAALVPKSEIEGDMGDNHVGQHARLMSQALRKLTGTANKTNCIIIFINQLREKIGVMYGSPEVTTGGRALKFYSTMRIDVRKGEPIKNGSELIGARTKAKIVKNKVAPPFKLAEFDIMYGTGVSKDGEILDMAVEYDIIHKGGSWFSYGDQRLGQGRDNVKKIIKDDPEFAAELENKIKEHLDSIKAEAQAKAKADAPVVDEPKPRITREEARARLDIAIDED